jgi:hypothetical protein
VPSGARLPAHQNGADVMGTFLVQTGCVLVLLFTATLVLTLAMEAGREAREREYAAAVRRLREREARRVGHEKRWEN